MSLFHLNSEIKMTDRNINKEKTKMGQDYVTLKQKLNRHKLQWWASLVV
ncbi:MAG: hypothetical protein HWD59_08705 [Coxiellaceae bacterium]|nr:MAG: hypothetical protein HWD59_08705 [Coxiellaceae bacterium]